jgi:hypothetical protein
VEALSAITVALAAVAVVFAWWTVRLGREAAREVRSDQIARRIEQIGAAIEAIYVSDDPANPTGIAQDRLAYTMMGLLPDLPETMKITQMLAFNRGMAAGIRMPGMNLSSGDEVRQQCVRARTELELKLTLIFTRIGDVPDPEKWINHPSGWEGGKAKHAKREGPQSADVAGLGANRMLNR